MAINYYWGSFFLAYLIHFISGCLSYFAAYFFLGLFFVIVDIRCNDRVAVSLYDKSEKLKVVLFIFFFILIEYFAVTKFFLHKEMILESVCFSIVVIIVIIISFIFSSFAKSFLVLFVPPIFCFLMTALLWTDLCYQKVYEKYENGKAINESTIITEEHYDILEVIEFDENK